MGSKILAIVTVRRKIMRKIAAGSVLILLLINFALPVRAQQGYTSGAYSEQVDNRSYFQRMSDWFATSGKSREEKALIKVRRRTARKIANARKTIARKKKEIAKKKAQYRRKLRARGRNGN